jgi:hypothetical protein
LPDAQEAAILGKKNLWSINQLKGALAMMSPQCSTCGTYYTGSEAYCARCGAPRVANPYQQNPYAQPSQQQQSGFGGFLQRYYTPQRIVRRWVIGRIIGLAVVLVVFGICAFFVLLSVLAAAAQH